MRFAALGTEVSQFWWSAINYFNFSHTSCRHPGLQLNTINCIELLKPERHRQLNINHYGGCQFVSWRMFNGLLRPTAVYFLIMCQPISV